MQAANVHYRFFTTAWIKEKPKMKKKYNYYSSYRCKKYGKKKRRMSKDENKIPKEEETNDVSGNQK